jgi:hypothetical protein
MRLWGLFAALVLALAVAALSLQTPRPRPIDAPPETFSAGRAMIDIREIAQRPHPLGTADHARVQALLIQRMTALGLEVSAQKGPLSPQAVRRIERAGLSLEPEALAAVNLIGVLPGSDPALPAVALMAHYDTTSRSPGAADDTTGVAAILETVRALKARGPAPRTLVVLLTDAEELNLDGARIFWGGHPLRDRIGAVVNLEARGGGGRAMMFETGPGNAQTIALFAESAGRAEGGVTSNALAVLVYGLMPNGTDFTLPRERGVQGINLAFIGRPEQYHSPASTPEALDQGSVQHIGAQALEMTDALLRAPNLPVATRDAVYADLFGRVVLRHPPAWGWGVLLAGLGLWLAAVLRTRRLASVNGAGLTEADIGRGALDGLWFLSAGVVVAHAVRALSGSLTAGSSESYYVLLARLPWMEAGVALGVLAVALALLGGRGRPDRRVAAGGVAAATALALLMGGFSPLVLGAGVVAMGLSLFPALAARTVWGGWSGAILLVLLLGGVVQMLAPQAAFLFLWPGLLAAATATAAAFISPDLKGRSVWIIAGSALVLAAAWLAGLAHQVFLGVGMDLPGVLALLGLLMVIFMRPFAPEPAMQRRLLMVALAVLALGAGINLAARVAAPSAQPPSVQTVL